MASASSQPFRTGTAIALLAAISFGVTAPFVKLAGRSLGPFSTAALLYLGAWMITAPMLRSHRDTNEPPVRSKDGLRILGIAIFGAALAPAALAWGLQRTSAASASLLLNTEALFTVLLARLVYREHIGPRIALALVLIGGGGAWLIGGADWRMSVGALAVLGASLGWALDNTIGRSLADRAPSHVVFWKSGAGAFTAALIAFASGEPLPTLRASACLLVLGATGYGLSLRFYLGAQRRLGSARTASIFACGPFIGAVVAVALGEPWLGTRAWVAAALLLVGLYLHLDEHHQHAHTHDAQDHEHAHHHDDGHHGHVHEPPVVGEHSHPHHHDAVEHDHPHAPDLHHQHRH